MKGMSFLKRTIKKARRKAADLHHKGNQRLSAFRQGITVKNLNELKYWRDRKHIENNLSNDHYVQFYTQHFDLDFEFYKGKAILDIGCGPRGSLEWASMTRKRVGLDPLANEYLKLGADKHGMSYVASGSEKIPFSDAHFDVITSFNSLDHVDDLQKTISEIKRVLKPGGLFLLLTEVNHEPTLCEPVTFGWEITKSFAPEFRLEVEKRYEKQPDGMYQSIEKNILFNESDSFPRPAYLSAKFEKAG